MIVIKEPKTEAEIDAYYDLRWRILRQPWGKPRGSEKDELESQSIHIMASEDERVVGVGRAHFNSPVEGQVRYMAVEENQQGKGIGKLVLQELEKKMKEKGAEIVVLNSRETATEFYKKFGYEIVERIPDFLGIPHYKMRKSIR